MGPADRLEQNTDNLSPNATILWPDMIAPVPIVSVCDVYNGKYNGFDSFFSLQATYLVWRDGVSSAAICNDVTGTLKKETHMVKARGRTCSYFWQVLCLLSFCI